jgi:YD repeat-containing protein
VSTDEQFPLEAARVCTTVRLDRPDGNATEIEWDDSGRVTTTHYSADGEPLTRAVVEFDAHGSFLLDEAPQQVARDTNPYGSTVERARYPDGTVVERSYDGEANLRRVRVAGPWGSQALELRTDGSRSLRWHTARLRGHRHWDAAGATTTSTVELTDDDLAEGTWDF